MVATIKMFKFSITQKDRVAAVAAYYTDATSVRYYTDSGESPGEWYGQGAMHLGLDGMVTKEQLFNLLRGKSPDGKTRLVRVSKPKTLDPDLKSSSQAVASPACGKEPGKKEKKKKSRADHMPGFDLTFSAPKSVAALWALSPPEVRHQIELAFDTAVKQTIDLFQEQVPLIRRGKGGVHREQGKLMVAMFDHVCARNNANPLLHRHSVFPNMAVTDSGEILKINSHEFLHWARTLGPLCRNNLLTQLNQRLGVEATRPLVKGKAAGWFELQGVAPALTDYWSSRTKEIHAQVDLLGGNASDVAAQKAANLRTRQAKSGAPNRSELFAKWAAEAKSLGVTPEMVASAIGRQVSIDLDQRVSHAMDTAVQELTAKNSTFQRRELIQALSEQLQDVPISGAQVIQVVDHTLRHSKELVHVKRKNGLDVFTSKAMWKLEEDVIQLIDKLATTPGLKLAENNIKQVLQSHPKLTDEQKQAVRHILSADRSIACMTGVPGAGKSTTLSVVADAYKSQGLRVVGISLSGVAAENLEQKTGAESRTIDSFLFHNEKTTSQQLGESVKHHATMFTRAAQSQPTWTKNPDFVIDKNSVVMLDEAGMVATERGRRVLKTIVDAGAKIISIGDLEQLSPIEAGCPFRTMIQKVGAAHLAENFRMKNDPLGLEAVAHVRAGQIDKALEIYAEKGDLKVLNNRGEAVRELVRDWVKDGGVQSPRDSIVLVQRKSEADHANRLIQNARLLEGAISQNSVAVAGQKFHIGDRVMFHETLGRLGIKNGNMGTVIAITKQGEVRVRLEKELSQQQLKRGISNEPLFKPVELTPDTIKLGYATTTHKFQGGTIPKAYVLAGGSLTSQNLTNVGLSRSEIKTKVYIDRDHAGPKLSQIAQAMAKKVQKVMAHEINSTQTISRHDRQL